MAHVPSRIRYVMGTPTERVLAESATRPAAPPDVLHVVPTALGRGAQVFARALVDELGGERTGHRLVSLFDGHSDIVVDVALGLPGGAGTVGGLQPKAVARLSRELHRMAPDMVVAHGGDAFKYVALATRAPIAYCVIGTWPAAAHRGLLRLLWRALIRRAWVAAAVSDDVAADCRAVLGVPDDRLVVIPNGRDAQHYRPVERSESAGPHDVTLLFVGRLDAGKRPDRFVEAVRTLRADGLEVTGKILGDGPMRGELEEPAARSGVELLGWCADIVPHLQVADVLVFPSAPDGEGMPGVLIEAGLCGVPAVATCVAGASTVIEHGTTGLLVPIDDLDALVGALADLARDAGRRRAMGKAARARCEAAFTLPVVAASWHRLLQLGLTPVGRGTRHPRAADLAALRATGPR